MQALRMSEKPEALRLADELDQYLYSVPAHPLCTDAAAELRRLHALYEAAKQAEPVQEPVAKVELMTTGGNAGLATRIVEIDNHLRERLRPGQLLYTGPSKTE